jgi:hypothetical protein
LEYKIKMPLIDFIGKYLRDSILVRVMVSLYIQILLKPSF